MSSSFKPSIYHNGPSEPTKPYSAYAAARQAQLLKRLRRWLETSPLWTDLRVWCLTQPERWRLWPTASRLVALALSAGLTAGVVGQPVVALAQEPVPVGSEFRVNSYTPFSQSTPDLAMDADGDFVVVWQSAADQDGSGDGIYAQRYNAAGIAQGGEFQVNSHTTNHQGFPAVAMDATGNFVVAWASDEQDGSGWGVYGQRYSAAGVKQGSEFRVNNYTTSNQLSPSVAIDDDGDFVVAWHSENQDDPLFNIYARRFATDGTPQGNEFLVSTPTTDGHVDPSVAVDASGNFVIAWQFGLIIDEDVYARIYDPNGLPQGDEFRVNSYTTGEQQAPSLAMAADGDFTVAWHDIGSFGFDGQDGSEFGVYAQRFSATGTRQGSEFPVNSYTTSSQTHPAVAMDTTGNFVVVWRSYGQDGSSEGVFGQRYEATGTPQGSEFQVNTFTTTAQQEPQVAMDASGDFVVVWESYEQPDDGFYGIYAQRYSGPSLDQKVYLPVVVKP